MNPSESEQEAGRNLDLSGAKDQRVFNLLEEAFQGWSNVAEEDEQQFRSPANRSEARRGRELLRQAQAIGTDNELLNMRMQELEAVIDAIPRIPWRRLVTPTILAIIPLVFLLVTKLQSDNVAEWALEVRESVWTVAEDAPLHQSSVDSVSDEVLPLRTVRWGTKVSPLTRRAGMMVQVRLETGEVGWLQVQTLKEGRALITESGTEFFTVDPFRSGGGPAQVGRLRGDLRDDQMELLPPGATAAAIRMLPRYVGW